MQSLSKTSLSTCRVLLRADLNVPMQDGQVSETTRLLQLAPTLNFLKERGTSVHLLSHFGRPKGRPTPDLSLKFLLPEIENLWQGPVAFAKTLEEIPTALPPSTLCLLENLRFYPGEEMNDPTFTQALASKGDFYINEAFSVCHRSHASVVGLPHSLPHAAGLALEKEVKILENSLSSPQRPLLAIVGGSKISTKLTLLSNLLPKVDTLVIGGAMAHTFLLAQGYHVGASLVEADLVSAAHDLLEKAHAQGVEVLLPLDAQGARKEGNREEEIKVYSIENIPLNVKIGDIGPKTIRAIHFSLQKARTVIWNGPLGAFEIPVFSKGTFTIAQDLANATTQGHLRSIVGGGDTLAALKQAYVLEKFSHVSTGGGAFLAWLEGKSLPGLQALK